MKTKWKQLLIKHFSVVLINHYKLIISEKHTLVNVRLWQFVDLRLWQTGNLRLQLLKGARKLHKNSEDTLNNDVFKKKSIYKTYQGGWRFRVLTRKVWNLLEEGRNCVKPIHLVHKFFLIWKSKKSCRRFMAARATKTWISHDIMVGKYLF